MGKHSFISYNEDWWDNHESTCNGKCVSTFISCGRGGLEPITLVHTPLSMNYEAPCFLCPQWTQESGRNRQFVLLQFNSLTQIPEGRISVKMLRAHFLTPVPIVWQFSTHPWWIGTLDFTVRRLTKSENTWVRKVTPEDPTLKASEFPRGPWRLKENILVLGQWEKIPTNSQKLYFLAAHHWVRETQTARASLFMSGK